MYILVKVYCNRTPSGSGKYVGFGLRSETGADTTTVVVDIRLPDVPSPVSQQIPK